MDEHRISGKSTDISKDEVKSFFEDRAAKKGEGTPSRYTPAFFLFDTDPELAQKRVVFENEQVLKRLERAGAEAS